MKDEKIIRGESQYLAPTYIRPDIVFSHGQGAYLYDTDGRRYLDFTAGIAVTALGHSDPEWAAVVAEQAHSLTHVSNLYHTAPHVELARRLVENSFADRVFFCNSGSEANEAALKFARKLAWSRDDHRRTGIVAFSGGFHGRTVGALSLTYKEQYRAPFAPLMPHVKFGEFNNLAAAEKLIDETTCAVFVEPVQGEGGVRPATRAFLQGLRRLCDRHGALLVFDEVQCGLGRTGRLWAHEHYDVSPDMMTLAKPLAGGLPIGATLITEEIAAALKPGDHGSTFAAGPLVCTAAAVVFDRVQDPDFLAAVQANSAYLLAQLKALLPAEQVIEVRGLGLLVGIVLDRPVRPIMTAAAAAGLLVINAGDNVLRLAPPLIVTQGQIDSAVQTLAKIMTESALMVA